MPLNHILCLLILHFDRPKLRPNPPRESIRPRNLRSQKIQRLFVLCLCLLLFHRRQLPHTKTFPKNSQNPRIPRRPPATASPLEIVPYNLVRSLAPPSGPDL
jgi:hypothetical protein